MLFLSSWQKQLVGQSSECSMKVVSLFAGAGGFDLGLVDAGHKIIWANDILEDACETYRKNIGNHIHCGDIAEVDFTKVKKPDLVIGGFPCQGFSIANMNRHVDDPRNRLYLEYLRALRVLQPRYFLAENVRGILSIEGGKVFKKIVQDFSDTGYYVQHQLVNVANYGVPQNRYRVLIFGVRKDQNYLPEFTLPVTHGVGKLPLRSVGEALKGIPEPDSKHSLKNHVCSQFKLKKNGYINHRQVDSKKPAPTVTARGDTKGGAMINHHPNNNRRMSVRETAIIQSFPKDFEFYGNMTSCYLQVGNAVPPKFASVLGHFLLKVQKKAVTPITDRERELRFV